MELKSAWDDFHLIKDKGDFELQILTDKIADILSDLKEVSKEDDYQQFSNSVITMWSSVLKVVEVTMEKRYLIDNGYCAR